MVIVPLGKLSFCILWRKGEILKGERGKPTYWCMLFQTNSLISFLVFLSFSLCFRSNLFSFPLTLLFLSRCEKSLVFPILVQGSARASL